MTFDWNEFDASAVEPAQDRGVIPPADYVAIISDSGMKPTKDGTGEYLELEFTIIDGPMADRKVWHRMNLVNQNETAVRIARAELSAICRCVGIMQPKDSSDLHNQPLVIRVGVRKDDKDRNEVKGFKPAQQGAQQAPQQAPATQQPARQTAQPSGQPTTTPRAQAPAANAATPPWKRGAK